MTISLYRNLGYGQHHSASLDLDDLKKQPYHFEGIEISLADEEIATQEGGQNAQQLQAAISAIANKIDDYHCNVIIGSPAGEFNLVEKLRKLAAM